MSSKAKKSLITDLWERRVPQFLATYVGICWGILQFLIFASNRYNLDNGIIDKFLIFSTILIPGVFIFIYNHGRSGRDPWKSYEKIILPLNFILALVFAGLMNPGNKMNAAPVEIQVTNEEGDTVTRVIPAVSETKSFGVFPLLNKSDESDSDWLKFAMPLILKRDLEQDMRMYCISPYGFDYAYKSNNANIYDNDIGFSKYLKMARDFILEYFITGEYTYKDEKLIGTFKVYESATGNLFYEENFEGEDIFRLVDEFTRNLSDKLFIDDSSGKIMVTDLPAAELITSNKEALKLFTLAKNEANLENDYAEALELIKQSVENDRISPMLKSYLASYHYSNGQVDTAIAITETALNLSDVLPERQKFTIRQQYYIYQQQMDKNIALLETWRKLYPRDYYPYDQLIDFYTMTHVINKAKEVGKDAVDNGHAARVLKRLAGFEITQGNYKEAEDYINRYYDLYPDKNKLEDTQLADIYLKQAEFDKAEKWFESILLLNPNDHNILIKLSDVYNRQWKFEESKNKLYEALDKVKVTEDSASVYQSLIFHYYRTGNVDKFKETADKHFELLSKSHTAMGAAFRHLQLGGLYTSFGFTDRIRELGELIQAGAPQLSSTYNCVADFLISMVEEDKLAFEKAYSGECKDIITRGTPTIRFLAEGYQAKMNKDYADAIRLLETYIDTTGQDKDLLGSIVAESYRMNKQYDKALEYCNNALVAHPSEATILLELAYTYASKSRNKKASDILSDIKNKIWKNSDERYIYYKKLLELEDQINES